MGTFVNKLKIALTVFFLILGFQNCSLNGGFDSQTESSSNSTFNETENNQVEEDSHLEDNTSPTANDPDGDNQGLLKSVIIALVRSSSHDGNRPENVIDQDLNTRWSAEGKGEFLDIQFGGRYKLSDIIIHFYKGSERTSHFNVLGWSDAGWVALFTDTNSPASGIFQSSVSSDASLSGIRIIGDGNNMNQWNSIVEVELSGYLQDPSVVALPPLEPSSPEEPPTIDDGDPGSVLSRVYLSTEDLLKIKELAKQGKEPIATAYNKAIANAEQAMSTKLQSVTYQGQSSHDYYTQKPYNWSNNMPSPCGSTHCDGYINPKADRGDYSASILMARAVRALGLAYALTGNTKYAERAIEHINSWAIDNSTYMSPKVFSSQGIEQYATFPAMFYGASLIQSYAGWLASERKQFLEWTKDFIYHAETYSYSNNWENWRQAFIITGASLINDKNLIDQQISKFKSTLTNFIDSYGRMKRELSRTRSLDYSMYALAAMTAIAEVANQRGENLYDYQVGSVGLKLAWQYHTPYLLNTSSWPYEQIKSYNTEGLGLYEIAYSRTGDPQYLQVINKYGRPLYEDRCFGPITLTHGTP